MVKRAPLVFETKASSPSANVPKTEIQANTQTRKQPISKAREGRRFIAAHVKLEAYKQFNVLISQQDRTTQSMVVEALNDLFAKYGMSRIADEGNS